MNERELFLAALEIEDPAARFAYLESVCDGELRAGVAALLASHEDNHDFLQIPAAEQVMDQLDLGDEDGAAAHHASVANEPCVAATSISAGPGSASDRRESSDEDEALTYLQPSTRPGSLGRLGHYEILEILGKGAFGTVLKAFDDKLQRAVAIKVMAPELAVASPARRRFLREAQASAAIRHEHVVSVYAVEEKPLPYLVMEYVPGPTLQQRLDEVGPLDVVSVLHLGRQIAEGLAAAHAMGLIHRDIKPGNVLLDTAVRDQVKITDFGLARAADDASLTQSGVIAGTPMYMAPEQALGQKLDRRADLFSFGSVLYQMVSGRPPFRAATTLAVLKRVAEDTPRPIRELIPESPQWLSEIIERLHAKNPNERFQSAREVADLLAICEAKLKSHSDPQELLSVVAQPSAVRFGRPHGIAAAVLLLPVLILLLTEMLGVTHVLRNRTMAAAPDMPPATVPWSESADGQPPLAIAPFDIAQAKETQAAWAKCLGTETELINSLGMKLVLIPPGKFLMGTPDSEISHKAEEGPQHTVEISQPFYLGSCEVTVAQYRAFVNATNFITETERIGGPLIWDFVEGKHKRIPDWNWRSPGYEQTDDHAVVCVTWSDACAFCQWLSECEGRPYSLPTEAQWEYACRAGTDTAYCFGDGDVGLDAYGWYAADSAEQVHPVGRKRANAWGLHDVHGNVWEWNADFFASDYYEDSPSVDPPGAKFGARVMRGGSRIDGAEFCRAGQRAFLRQDASNDVVGFRVACAVVHNASIPVTVPLP